MITEDEATRLLKRADPALVDDGAPFVDAAGYLAALGTRSTTVTLVDTEPAPTRRPSRHRWLIAAAAVVAAIVVGGVVLIAGDDGGPHVPADTTVAPEEAAAAEQVARGFLDAYAANDADRALTHLTDSALATWGSAEEFRREIAWNEAARFEVIVNDCARLDADTAAGITVRCGFDFHEFGSDAIGLGPYGDAHWDLTVRDGNIVAASDKELNVASNGSSAEMWGPFETWIRTEHPDDLLVMYPDPLQVWGLPVNAADDEALQRWEQRTQQYVQAVLAGAETYAGDVGTICANLDARLGELALPADGALEHVAGWNTAAATIMDEAHAELIALDRPPGDTQAYSTFYGQLGSLVTIAEDSAEAATAGDTGRLAELDAEYLEVRQTMSGSLAGSGLEDCLASLPS